MDTCCTCLTALASTAPCAVSTKAEPEDRRLQCCDRVICGGCIQHNHRFATYCPYCQVSSLPSSLPQGLKDLPSYTTLPMTGSRTAEVSGAPPPAYTVSATVSSTPTHNKKAPVVTGEKDFAEDTLHFLNHDYDTIASLSLRYGVPAAALRQRNNITSDHLLLGRRTILIPGEHYKDGVSLSPRPVEGEEEESRRNKIRRFMTSCKVSDYDVALLYLEQSDYDLDAAVEACLADEAWERDQSADKVSPAKKGLKPYKNRGRFWRGL